MLLITNKFPVSRFAFYKFSSNEVISGSAFILLLTVGSETVIISTALLLQIVHVFHETLQ